MTSVLANFPHQLEDEPTEDWTVEHVLQWWLLRSQEETHTKYDDLVEALNQEMDKAKTELWDCHDQVKDSLKAAESTNENEQPQGDANQQHANQQSLRLTRVEKKTQAAATTAPPSKPKTNGHCIYVEIIGGEYIGSSFELRPASAGKTGCFVGRSTGKRFREKGISLARDLEVSTTHGKFEVKGGKSYYTDAGSTNGSRVGAEELEPETPYLLEDGTEVTVGQTVMRITLEK